MDFLCLFQFLVALEDVLVEAEDFLVLGPQLEGHVLQGASLLLQLPPKLFNLTLGGLLLPDGPAVFTGKLSLGFLLSPLLAVKFEFQIAYF